jgi:hypothetical protein
MGERASHENRNTEVRITRKINRSTFFVYPRVHLPLPRVSRYAEVRTGPPAKKKPPCTRGTLAHTGSCKFVLTCDVLTSRKKGEFNMKVKF